MTSITSGSRITGPSNSIDYDLVCFDLDGTLIDDTEYIWLSLHDAFGVSREQRRLYFEAYQSGQITYTEWFETDLLEWVLRGKRRQDLVEVIAGLSVMPGALETVRELKRQGRKLAIISGSIDLVIHQLLPEHDFDDVLVNQISFSDDGVITGGTPTRFDMAHKADGLRLIADREGIPLSRCAFIGDHENDLQIAALAGFTIAFNSKSAALNEIADVVVAEKDLRRILEYL